MPSAAKVSASARPMPLAPPVMTAVLSRRSSMSALPREVVALVDVRPEGVRVDLLDRLGGDVRGALRVHGTDIAFDREIGDGIELRVAQHELALDALHALRLSRVHGPDEQR